MKQSSLNKRRLTVPYSSEKNVIYVYLNYIAFSSSYIHRFTLNICK